MLSADAILGMSAVLMLYLWASTLLQLLMVLAFSPNYHADLWMQVIVTLLVLFAGLYVILNPHYAADDKKWAYGIVGTVVGYWLKGTRD